MEKPRCLIIDDERDVEQVEYRMRDLYGKSILPNAEFVICKDYNSGILALMQQGPWDVLYLDHDIASYDENYIEKTGYSVMCFLEEEPRLLPKKIYCISASPVGRQRINQVISKLYGG